MNRLQTIDADTLQSTAYEPVSFVVDDLLPQGLHLLAGAPKIGKSWLALWLCLCAAQGKPLWTFATHPCEVLYLCLEDSFQRIQSRLFDLTEDAPPTLHFAVMSQQLHNGLVEQIEQFLKEHPQTKLIVIDTLQRIRTAGNDANPYASDYRDIGVLKALADKHRIAILLVHHLRKMNDDDPMNMISGTTGLSGATDSNFVLRKSKRRENTATLYCTGRDIPYRELALEFDGEDHVWKLLSDDCEQTEQPTERILFLLSELLRRQPEISAPAKVLLEKIDPAGTEGLTPNSFSHRIRKSVDALRRNGITVSFRKSNGDRLICLKRADGVDDLTTENIATIKDFEAKRKANKKMAAEGSIAEHLENMVNVGYPLIVARIDGLDAGGLRNAWDILRGRMPEPGACVIGTINNGKPVLMAAATDEAVAAGFNAGNVIKAIAGNIKGGGGGKPTMAQAGGKDAAGIDAALDAARELLAK